MTTTLFVIWLRIPSGASWRFSRYRVKRIVGDWWLPRWYSIGVRLEERVAPAIFRPKDDG